MPDLEVCLIRTSLSQFLKSDVCDNCSFWPGAVHIVFNFADKPAFTHSSVVMRSYVQSFFQKVSFSKIVNHIHH